MTIGEIMAQIFALAGLGSNIASVQCKRRIWVLLFQIAANVLYAVQYVFLDAWPAFAVSMVSAVECIVVYYYANGADRAGTDLEKPLTSDQTDTGRRQTGAKCRQTDNKADDNKVARMPLPVLLLIMIATTVFGLMDYTDALSLLPIIVTIAYSWAVWQPNLRIFRVIAVLIPICWFIYNMHVGAWVSVCTAVVETISALSAIVRIDILSKKS